MILVHSFSPVHKGFDDYERFVGLFGIEAEKNQIYKAGRFNGIDLFIGWVSDHNEYGADVSDDLSYQGTVTAKKCECCGHHEIGIETDAGEYIPLKTGMKVEIKI